MAAHPEGSAGSRRLACPPVLPARAAGRPAGRLLDQASRGVVIGLSSRGAFLRLVRCPQEVSSPATDRIVFLSGERFRGPLTINLLPSALSELSLHPGDTFAVRCGTIHFSRSGAELCIDGAALWSAPPLPASILPVQERRALFERVCRQICAQRDLSEQEDCLLPPVPRIGELISAPSGAERSRSAGSGKTSGAAERSRAAIPAEAAEIASSRRTRFGPPRNDTAESVIASPAWLAMQGEAISSNNDQATRLMERLKACLGRGPGLTPAGDDLVLGVLLALARWGDVLCPGLSACEIASPLVAAARNVTTSLSAQLLECAAQGQADERLIAALDGLICGVPDEASIVGGLLDWGHTSGAAAFWGMGSLI